MVLNNMKEDVFWLSEDRAIFRDSQGPCDAVYSRRFCRICDHLVKGSSQKTVICAVTTEGAEGSKFSNLHFVPFLSQEHAFP